MYMVVCKYVNSSTYSSQIAFPSSLHTLIFILRFNSIVL